MSDDLMRIAQDARKANGGPLPSVDEMFRGLMEGVAREKFAWWSCVEMFVISRAEAYQVYADALGRSVETLTKTEKQTAFLNHVMEEQDPALERSE